MSIDVFVISTDESDWLASEARKKIKTHWPDFHVVLCSTVERLVYQIGSLVLTTGQHIEQLDFHGHGGPGIQRLGRETLFDHNGSGMSIAQKLSVFLTDYARVRLLGCDSVMGANGAKLLRSLKCEFGRSVVVQGTIKNVALSDFDERGFVRMLEEQWLFSTTDLDAGVPDGPSEDERVAERVAWLRRVAEVMGSYNAPQ